MQSLYSNCQAGYITVYPILSCPILTEYEDTEAEEVAGKLPQGDQGKLPHHDGAPENREMDRAGDHPKDGEERPEGEQGQESHERHESDEGNEGHEGHEGHEALMAMKAMKQ